MKILVFDDSPIHRAAAKAQLADHELAVVATYDEALDELLPRHDVNREKAILAEQFGAFNPWRGPGSDDEEKKAAYFAASDAAREQATTYPDYDVVLTDLLVPATKRMQGDRGMQYVGEEMPTGVFIGLLAAVRARVKLVAVFTDSDRHSHPASACYDDFNRTGESEPTPFRVEESLVFFCNNRCWVDQFAPGDLTKALEYEEFSKRSDTVRAKNWAELLAYLVSCTPS